MQHRFYGGVVNVNEQDLEDRFKPTSVRVSYDQEIIMVGFKDGGLEAYSLSDV